MIQFQRSSRLGTMPEAITHNGKLFTLIMKGGGIARKIREYRYDHPEKEYIEKDPDGRGFMYLYGTCDQTR